MRGGLEFVKPGIKTAPKMSERELQDAILDYATLRNWRTYHTFDSRHSSSGFPDIILCRRERLLAIELKSDTGRITGEQLAWLGSFADAGAETYVWRPADWPDVVEAVLR